LFRRDSAFAWEDMHRSNFPDGMSVTVAMVDPMRSDRQYERQDSDGG
jgi:hypothetical protein